MSLLMEALKKAEEAKRRAGDGGDTPELTLEPLPTPNTSASPLPDLAQHLATVDADLASIPTNAPPRRRPGPAPTPENSAQAARDGAERATVRNAFAAKQTPPDRSRLGLLLGAGTLAVLGIAGYFWWQLQSLHPSQSLTARPASSPAPLTPPTKAASLPTPALAPPPSAPAPQAAIPPARPSMSDVPAPGTETPLFQTTKASPGEARPAPRNARPGPAGNPLQLTRGDQPATIERAYDALQAGRLDDAGPLYESVLRGDRKNTDALLGLASIASRRGQNERAQALYQQALESDPHHPAAQAGVIGTRGQADPGMSESRLKTALAAQPEAPALLFALGNLYARQQRWSEAQQAYFRAYAGEPDNADFIFNLAVSLDQLRQPRLAAQYYKMALEVSEVPGARAAIFDRQTTRTRLAELAPPAP